MRETGTFCVSFHFDAFCLFFCFGDIKNCPCSIIRITTAVLVFPNSLIHRCTAGDVGRTGVSVIKTTRIAGNPVELKAWVRSRWLSWQLVLPIRWRFPHLNPFTHGEEGECYVFLDPDLLMDH